MPFPSPTSSSFPRTFLHLLAGAAVVALVSGTSTGLAQVIVREEAAIVGGPFRQEPKPMPPGTGSISGHVLEAPSNTPVPGALVSLRLTSGDAAPVRLVTDAQGRYLFTGLPPGNFQVSASKAGLEGRGRFAPQVIAEVVLPVGEPRALDPMHLVRQAAISGRVTDNFGEPVVGLRVRAYRRSFVGGQPRLTATGDAVTDDRGIYRVGLLSPGTYVVSTVASIESPSFPMMPGANAISARPAMAIRVPLPDPGAAMGPAGLMGAALFAPSPPGHVRTYFAGGTTASRAEPIVLAAGDDRTGVDFVSEPGATFTVTGQVSTPDGPGAGITVTLGSVDDASVDGASATSFTDGNGMFTFENVPAGPYVVRVRPGASEGVFMQTDGGGGRMTIETVRVIRGRGTPLPSPAAMTYAGEAAVAIVDRAPDPIALVLSPAGRVSGRVEFRGGTAPASARPTIWLESNGYDASSETRARPTATVQDDGSFSIAGVIPGRYFVRARAPQGWIQAGADLGGRDVAESPFEMTFDDVSGITVIFGNQGGEIAGQIAGADSDDEELAVHVFPTDRATWAEYPQSSARHRTITFSRDYVFGEIPPGEYYVVARPGAVMEDAGDPSVREALAARAAVVRVGQGQKVQLPLQVAR